MIVPVMGFFRRKPQTKSVEQDPYESIVGEKMDVEALLIIRELEDFWIDGRVISEEDREPVPEYLREEWIAKFGLHEELRSRDSDNDVL